MNSILGELGPFFTGDPKEACGTPLSEEDLRIIKQIETAEEGVDPDLVTPVSLEYYGRCGFADNGRRVRVVNRDRREIAVTIEVEWHQGTRRGTYTTFRNLRARSSEELGCNRSTEIPLVVRYYRISHWERA